MADEENWLDVTIWKKKCVHFRSFIIKVITN